MSDGWPIGVYTTKKDPEEAKKAGAEFDRVDRNQLSGLNEHLRGPERNA